MPNDIKDADLVDVITIRVDKNLPQSERSRDFKKQIKTPNHYKCGDFTIHAIYSSNGDKMEDCLRGMVT